MKKTSWANVVFLSSCIVILYAFLFLEVRKKFLKLYLTLEFNKKNFFTSQKQKLKLVT